MKKIIQISSCAALEQHSLYALTEDGKVYERKYFVVKEGRDCDVWEEIEETFIRPVGKFPF